ncbi:MAG: hypothetical protein Q9180_005792 [Flavoplaca navasiana]
MVTTRSKRALSEISPNASPKRKAARHGEVEKDKKAEQTAISNQQPHQPTPPHIPKIPRSANPRTFITLCPRGIRHKCRISPQCLCMCPATHDPTHPFCITKRGEDLYRCWRYEQVKRDAEIFGVVGDMEFTGYGTREVVENILLTFDKAVRSEQMDVWVVWAHIEGLARFLSQRNWAFYHISDHSTTNLIQLIGTALLTTIDLLTTNHLFHPDSPIRNIGFILGLFLEFVIGYEEACEGDEDGWRFVVVRKMYAYGIQVSGTERARGVLQGLREIVREEEEAEKGRAEQRNQVEGEGRNENKGRDGGSVGKKGDDGVGRVKDGEDDRIAQKKVPNFINAYTPDTDPEAECREWDLWDWKVELQAYTTHHSTNAHIGGTRYDLTLAENWESDQEDESE